MIIYSIYKITNTITGQCYIGCTKMYPPRRFDNHRHKALNTTRNNLLYQAIRKYGWKQFKKEIIFQSNSPLDDMEEHFILENDSFNNGYNGTHDGKGGGHFKDDCKVGIRLANIGKPCSDETKQKLRDINLGQPFKGNQHVRIP